MPNGNLGGGDGSQATPYLIYDPYDLNALRNKPSTSMVYVKFMDDIDFTDTPYALDFPTIRMSANTATNTAYDFVSIDGNNKTIRNFKQNGSGDNYKGLFARITAEYIKNLSLINCSLGGTNGFAEVIISDLIDNLVITGVAPTSQTFHGLAYTVGGYTGAMIRIQNCTIALKIQGGSSTYNGYSFQTASNKTVYFFKCVSACNIYSTASGPGMSGFVGNVSANTTTFDSCISACRFVADNSTKAFGSSISVAGFHSSPNSAITFINCISKCEFIGSPPSTSSRMSPFSGNNGSSISQCYSLCRYDLQGSSVQIQGGMGKALFDYEVSGLPLSQFSDGASFGCTTAQLKSKSFLQSKGWTF